MSVSEVNGEVSRSARENEKREERGGGYHRRKSEWCERRRNAPDGVEVEQQQAQIRLGEVDCGREHVKLFSLFLSLSPTV